MRQLTELLLLFGFSFIGSHYALAKAMQSYVHLGFLVLLSLAVLLLIVTKPAYTLATHIAVAIFFAAFPQFLFFVPPFIYATLLKVLPENLKGNKSSTGKSVQTLVATIFPAGLYAALLLVGFSANSLFVALLAGYLAYNTYVKTVQDNTTTSSMDDLRAHMMQLTKDKSQLQLAASKNKEIAILQERDRIARSLHDSVGHTISSSLVQLQALDVQVDAQPVKNDINQIRTTLSQGMQAIRAQLYDLRDTAFDAHVALQTIAQEISEPKIDVYYGLQDCSYAIKQQLVLFVKEAIANTIKHSDATTMRVVLTSNQANHIMTIKDNGTIPPQQITPGIGLANMQQFARENAGQCTFHYRDGFSIHLCIQREN